ncbi:hypothetical protein L208DRAFT_1393541 [Tricholoma matsutake]|nr:hypothetical protein L208DRAFT_1393541 [Tricholoma matsutake 945]
MGSDAMSTVDVTAALVPVKKWKSGTLAGMVDYPLSEVQKAQAWLIKAVLFTPIGTFKAGRSSQHA